MPTLIRLDIPPVSAANDFANVSAFIRSNPLKQQKHARIIGNLLVVSGERLVTLLSPTRIHEGGPIPAIAVIKA
jgi:hypothetical protein